MTELYSSQMLVIDTSMTISRKMQQRPDADAQIDMERYGDTSVCRLAG